LSAIAIPHIYDNERQKNVRVLESEVVLGLEFFCGIELVLGLFKFVQIVLTDNLLECGRLFLGLVNPSTVQDITINQAERKEETMISK